ncbi:hypothetical protein D3C71_1694300 [compost metagenome]
MGQDFAPALAQTDVNAAHAGVGQEEADKEVGRISHERHLREVGPVPDNAPDSGRCKVKINGGGAGQAQGGAGGQFRSQKTQMAVVAVGAGAAGGR